MVNRLDRSERAKILAMLCEGMGVNAVCRISGSSKMTVLKLVADVGQACADYMNKNLHGLQSKRVECDEIWSFCYSKGKTAKQLENAPAGAGDVWTWTAIDSDTKLLITYLVGSRDAECANVFMKDVASRLSHRVQLTTDGHLAYIEAVEEAFGGEVDYARLIKLYGPSKTPEPNPDHRYSPSSCVGIRKEPVAGRPWIDDVSTSFVERANLTIRMQNRRFTRLTNAFSKKIDNHIHSFSICVMSYNFCKQHRTLQGSTPAMAAGITDHIWDYEELIDLLKEKELPRKRGKYGIMKRAL